MAEVDRTEGYTSTANAGETQLATHECASGDRWAGLPGRLSPFFRRESHTSGVVRCVFDTVVVVLTL